MGEALNSLEKRFYSKILLFGEYSVIKSSKGLSLPYSLFDGGLAFRRDQTHLQDPELKALAQYLKDLEQKELLDFDFDVTSLEFDIGQGLYFDSSIPQGFGVGSSGALCAALYYRYGPQSLSGEALSELKRRFAIIESHFHGSSSGLDPLISYKSRPILIKSQEKGETELEEVSLPDRDHGHGGIFLLNTGRPRRTEPLVNLFLEKCNSPKFDQLCLDRLLPLTNSCIEHFLRGNWPKLYNDFHALSRFQYEHFSPMIPKLFQDVWKKGFESEDYALKLCGAGGGGFLLGMTPNFKRAQSTLKAYEIRPVMRF